MFSTITTLRDLNAARIQASSAPDADLVAINNAYNEARQRILTQRTSYKKCNLVKVQARECALHRSIPIGGYSPTPGTIYLTKKGFLC